MSSVNTVNDAGSTQPEETAESLETSRLTAVTQECYKCLSEAVKTANTMPHGEARDLYGTYTGFHATVDHLTEAVLMMANSIARSQGLKPPFKKTTVSTDELTEINDFILDNIHSNSESGRQARASNKIKL